MTVKAEKVEAKVQAPAFPKVDVEALFALQRANLETLFQAHKLVFDLFETLTRRQAELVKEMMARAEDYMKGFDPARQPKAYVEDARAAIEKAMAEMKQAVELGLETQKKVVELFVQRASANLDEVKRIAA